MVLNTTNGWEKIGDTWYYFDSEGWMKTGWIKEYGNWYYLDDSGAMKLDGVGFLVAGII